MGKNDIDWKNPVDYADYAFLDNLTYIPCDNTPQQVEDSK